MLAEYDGGSDVIVHDGMKWGFEILANYDVTLDTVGSTPYNTSDFFHLNFNAGPSDVYLDDFALDLSPVSAFFDPTDTPPGTDGSGLAYGPMSGLGIGDFTVTGVYDGSDTLRIDFIDDSFCVGDSMSWGLDVDLWSQIDWFGATPHELNGALVSFTFSDGYTSVSRFDKFISGSLYPDWSVSQTPINVAPIPAPGALVLVVQGLLTCLAVWKRRA